MNCLSKIRTGIQTGLVAKVQSLKRVGGLVTNSF